MNHQAPLTDERRMFPRIDTRLPVVLSHEDNQCIKTYTHNLSRGGMQVRCGRLTAHRLNPNGKVVNGQNAAHLLAEVQLPLNAGTTVMTVLCRLVHLSIVPDADEDAKVALGFEFVGFPDDDGGAFQRYIEEALLPPLNAE